MTQNWFYQTLWPFLLPCPIPNKMSFILRVQIYLQGKCRGLLHLSSYSDLWLLISSRRFYVKNKTRYPNSFKVRQVFIEPYFIHLKTKKVGVSDVSNMNPNCWCSILLLPQSLMTPEKNKLEAAAIYVRAIFRDAPYLGYSSGVGRKVILHPNFFNKFTEV